MKLQNDELIIWKDNGDMILDGEVVNGELIITNRRINFRGGDSPRSILGRKESADLWDLDIWKVKEVTIIEIRGIKYPMIRLSYSEHEVYFTFPKHEPRQTLAGIVVFINHARMIERIMDLMKNVDRSLKKRTLNVGENIPQLRDENPKKADENCYQCGKTLLEDELDEIDEEVKECMSCIPEMH